MGLETFDTNSRPDVLDPNWPLGTDPLNKGDDHVRLIKTVLKNFFNDYSSYVAANDLAVGALEGFFTGGQANSALDSDRLGGVDAAQFAQIDGTYLNLRAQATTKDDVGLSLVNNWGATSSINDTSTTKYATARAAYDAARSSVSVPSSINAIRSYAFLRTSSGKSPGGSESASSLRYAEHNANFTSSPAPSGTWRCMGDAGSGDATLYIRIS